MTGNLSSLFTPLLTGGIAVLGSGFSSKGWTSRYTWVNAAQITGSALAGTWLLDALAAYNVAGFLSAHRTLSNAVGTGLIYGGVRKYFEKGDTYLNDAGYGAGLELLADILTPSVGSATGLLPPGGNSTYSQGAALVANIVPPNQQQAWTVIPGNILNSY